MIKYCWLLKNTLFFNRNFNNSILIADLNFCISFSVRSSVRKIYEDFTYKHHAYNYNWSRKPFFERFHIIREISLKSTLLKFEGIRYGRLLLASRKIFRNQAKKLRSEYDKHSLQGVYLK